MILIDEGISSVDIGLIVDVSHIPCRPSHNLIDSLAWLKLKPPLCWSRQEASLFVNELLILS